MLNKERESFLSRNWTVALLALVTVAFLGSSCALIRPKAPRSKAERQTRLKYMDTHLKNVGKNREQRRQIVAGSIAGVGVAILGTGLYVQNLEEASGNDSGLSTTLIIVGLVGAGVGLFMFFIPSEIEERVENYQAQRDEESSAETLLFGERTLQKAAIEDQELRLRYGLPAFLLGVGGLISSTSTPGLTSDSVSALATISGLTAIVGAIITFSPTDSEQRWDRYLSQVRRARSKSKKKSRSRRSRRGKRVRTISANELPLEDDAPAFDFVVVPIVTGDGGGVSAAITF